MEKRDIQYLSCTSYRGDRTRRTRPQVGGSFTPAAGRHVVSTNKTGVSEIETLKLLRAMVQDGYQMISCNIMPPHEMFRKQGASTGSGTGITTRRARQRTSPSRPPSQVPHTLVHTTNLLA